MFHHIRFFAEYRPINEIFFIWLFLTLYNSEFLISFLSYFSLITDSVCAIELGLVVEIELHKVHCLEPLAVISMDHNAVPGCSSNKWNPFGMNIKILNPCPLACLGFKLLKMKLKKREKEEYMHLASIIQSWYVLSFMYKISVLALHTFTYKLGFSVKKLE